MRIYKRLKRYFRPSIPSAIPESQAVIEEFGLKKGDIFLDCGANIGRITGIAAKTGATVHAFEPNPYAFAQLERTFRFYGNVHCYQQAVGDEDTDLELYLHEHASEDQIKWSEGSSILAEKTNINTATSVIVKCIDLAAFIENLDKRVRLLKMDIEGAEYETLSHLIHTGVIERIDQLYVESHHQRQPFLKPQYHALQQLIAEHHVTNIQMDWI